MPESTIRIRVPLESLLDSIPKLNLKQKLRLWELLEQQIAQADEDTLEQDPEVQAQIRAARADYQAGDYVTIDEYISKRRKRPR